MFRKYILFTLVFLCACKIVTVNDLKRYYKINRIVYPRILSPDVKNYSCGQAVFIYTLKYFGVKKDFTTLPRIFFAEELISELRKYHLKVKYSKGGSLKYLIENIKKERISIVFLKRSKSDKYGHFAIFLGLDFDKYEVYLFDNKNKHPVNLHTFLSMWNEGDKLFITVEK